MKANMHPEKKNAIYTIGHSTRSWEEFTQMLQSFGIKALVDIRRFPGSKRYPYFNREPMAAALRETGIEYTHLEGLGGRRKVKADSENNRWRNDSFRGYADYMETLEFKEAIEQLQSIARKQPTAYMCSEAVWWRCHRAMVSDYLKAKGWPVYHIMGAGKAEGHPYTSAARVAGDEVFYSDDTLFPGH